MKNWKIGIRIVVRFAWITSITVLIAVLSYSRPQKIQASENEVAENAITSLNSLKTVAAPAEFQATDSISQREMSDIESKFKLQSPHENACTGLGCRCCKYEDEGNVSGRSQTGRAIAYRPVGRASAPLRCGSAAVQCARYGGQLAFG